MTSANSTGGEHMTDADSLLEKERREEDTSALKKPIPAYIAYPISEKTMTNRPPLKTISILPQFSHLPEDNLLYMTILPLALDSFKSSDDLLTFEEIWTHVIGKNSDVRGTKNIFHNIIKLDNHHFSRWSLGRGTACVYYMKHSLSQVVIAPNDKRITSLYTAFKKRHITPKIFSSLNQKKIPLHYELPVYEREKGRFSYPEDIQQLTFLKTHLIQVNTSTGSIQFVPFAIRWQAPEGDVHVTRKRTKEFYRNMEKKIEEAIMVHLIEVVNSTYKRIILLLRKEFPTLLIDEIRRILERLVNKRSVVHRIGHEKYEGTMFKVGDGVTTAIIRRVQEKLARRRAEAVIIDINLGQKRGNPANSSVQRGRGSAAGTSQSRMNTRGNQTPEPVITSLHNLTGNQLSIEIGHPADLNQKEDLKWSSWSIMDSGKVDNSQSSSAPMEDAMACNQSTVAGPDSPGNSSITSEEIAPDAGFLDDFPDDIFEQSSEVGMNNLHYVESSGNWPQPIGQEGFSQPFWALPDGQGEEGREEPIDLEQEIIVVDPQEQKKEPTFKVPKGRAPRRKRTITENGKPESSKRPKDIEMEHDDDFFGDI